jgi:hypothetical protein
LIGQYPSWQRFALLGQRLRANYRCTNYVKLSSALGLADALVKQPALVLEPINACRIMSIGITKGVFTGRKPAPYITAIGKNYVEAR